MCWNKEVSLNTFIFSSFVLLLIMYNNKYTQYKVKEFNNIWVNIFFMSFILMQLIEFMIWRNIDNKKENEYYSKMAILLLFLQPVASLMMLKDNVIRMNLILLYLCLAVPFSIFRFITKDVKSIISDCGHLKWDFLTKKNELYIFMGWLFFFLFSFFYNGDYLPLLFGIITLLLISYNYINDESVGSMWCWIVNSIMIYYATYLLMYLPFKEVIQKQ